MIVTITPNPAIDVSTSVAKVGPEHKLRCGPERRDAGGGGINVARVVRRMGGEATALFLAGGPIGELLTRLLAVEGLPARAIPIAGDTRESFTVFEETSGQEYRFVLPGPTVSASELAALTQAAGGLSGWVVASGSLPPGAPADTYARLARAAKAAGAKFVVDASGPALREALEAGLFLAKPSRRELEQAVGSELAETASQAAACRRLIETGKASRVALTLGPGGAVFVTERGAWAADPLPLKVVSSVGAGDSFLAAMVWALASGRTDEEALRYGMAAGSAALLTPGTELCRREDVERLAPQVSVRRL